MAEAERGLHHPAPPPPGSALHAQLVAAAAGAVAHGALQPAVKLLQAAGAWIMTRCEEGLCLHVPWCAALPSSWRVVSLLFTRVHKQSSS